MIYLIACILSGILYRMGGAKGFNTKFRDWGCPATLIGLLLLTNNHPINTFGWVMLGLFFVLSWGALSTYWDEFFGYDNHFAHGFGCGLAGLLLVVFVPWWLLLIRLVICTVGMGLWSKWISHDVAEEFGRGVLFII